MNKTLLEIVIKGLEAMGGRILPPSTPPYLTTLIRIAAIYIAHVSRKSPRRSDQLAWSSCRITVPLIWQNRGGLEHHGSDCGLDENLHFMK